MAEHDRDRTDQAQDAVQERNIVRDGGIARSDAEIEDVSRDTYGSPIGPGGEDDHEATAEDRTRAREVLGISDVAPDSSLASGGSEVSGGSDSARRRRSDDLVEGGIGGGLRREESGAPYEGPDGLKVRD
jgi:hypothetical protein